MPDYWRGARGRYNSTSAAPNMSSVGVGVGVALPVTRYRGGGDDWRRDGGRRRPMGGAMGAAVTMGVGRNKRTLSVIEMGVPAAPGAVLEEAEDGAVARIRSASP